MKWLKITGVILGLIVMGFLLTGVFSKKIEYGNELIIEKPAAEVWAVFVDPRKLKEWMPGLVRIDILEGMPPQVGSITKFTMENGKEKMEMTETITHSIPGKLFAFDVEADVLTGKNEIRFEETPEGNTKLISKGEAVGKNFFWRAIFFSMKKYFQKNDLEVYEKLKEVVEKG